MALIKCPDCKSPVSSEARACPRCGYPVKKVEYMYHSVTHFGSVETRGEKELAELLAQGWQIIDEDDSDTWVDSDGYHCRLYKYRLMR